MLAKEMKKDYTDEDELQKIRTEACLPDENLKEKLWEEYTLKTENKFSINQFNHSSFGFGRGMEFETQMKYASKFFQIIKYVKETYHRDYA